MAPVLIVIPVARDTEGLTSTLEHLHDALGDRTETRVVVAVDGPHGDAEAVARSHGADVVVLPDNRGSYAARNAAIDRALAEGIPEAVMFTDAGCRPRPGWVDAHRTTLERAELSGGAIEIVVPDPLTPAAQLDRSWHLRQEVFVTQQQFAATGNLAVQGRVLRDHRFDARRRSGGDREFCRRVVATGATIAYTPDAVVEHDARATAAELEEKLRRIADGIRAGDDQPPRPDPVGWRGAARLLRAGWRAGAVHSARDAAELVRLARLRVELIDGALGPIS